MNFSDLPTNSWQREVALERCATTKYGTGESPFPGLFHQVKAQRRLAFS